MEKTEEARVYLDQLERRVLAYMAMSPKEAFPAIEEIGIVREYFSNEAHAAAFSAMLMCGPEDPKKLNRALCAALGGELDTNAKVDVFLDLAVPTYKMRAYFLEFAQNLLQLQFSRKIAELGADITIRPCDKPEAIERLTAEMRGRMEALERFRGAPVEVEGEFDGTVPTPEELMDMPGFVNDLAAYTYAIAHRPNRVLAFGAALAMLSHLVGRKYTDRRKTRPNLYLAALADSGVGKDDPRKVNKALADSIEALDEVGEQIGSGEGLEDSLFERPNMLYQMDEFDGLLNSLKESSPINERIYTYLLTFFSESGTSHALRRKALSQEAKEAMAANPTATAHKPSLKIYNPSLTIFASAIPEHFYKSLSMRALDNGLLARCLVLEAGKRGKAGDGPFDAPLPPSVLQFAQMTRTRDKMLQWGAKVEPYVVPDDAGVDAAAKRIRDEADKLYDKAAAKNDAAGKAIWNRGYEITAKLALLYALSENLANPLITVKGFEWGWRLVQYSSKRMLAMAAAYIATDKEDDDCNRVVRYLSQCKGKKAPRSAIMHDLHFSKKRMDSAEETLVDRNSITVIPGAHGATIYRLVPQKKGR